jgi:hypothetical protein
MTRTKRYVQRSDDGKWGVTAKGELWKLGRHGYMAGYISRPHDIDSFTVGIEAAEEEARILLAEAYEELST